MKRREFFYTLGRPFSPFYSLAMRFREYLYRIGLFRIVQAGVPVISIGNLTMGGSGKTPIVQYTARLLQDNGYKPAVVSRGYGGTSRRPVNVVSDGREVFMSASEAGDEPRFLADTLEEIPVLTGARRKDPAAQAVKLGADTLVLDDGFQHIALHRDIDLVLFNADFLAGNSRVFPGGDLREPVKSLHRCHGFIITGISKRNEERAGQFKSLLHDLFPDHPVFLSRYTPLSLVSFVPGDSLIEKPLSTIKKTKVYGFSGIAHPANFQATLAEVGVFVAGFQEFGDHHVFDRADMEWIHHDAKRCGAKVLLTTEKDLVKLQEAELPVGEIPLFALRMEVQMDNDFNQFILSRLA